MDEATTIEPGVSQEYVSTEEAADAIRRLSDTEVVKLDEIAKFYYRARRLSECALSPRDLVHEAIVKTCDGDRRWRRGTSLIRHLDAVMKSISSHAREQARARLHRPMDVLDSPRHSVTTDASLPAQLSPEERAIARDETDALIALFRSDPKALRILAHRAGGLGKRAIMEDLELTSTEYDTVAKRIRRRLVAYAEGREVAEHVA